MPERIYNTPLAKKLGLTPAKPIPMQVALIAAPENFSDLLGDLPAFTTLTLKLSPSTDLALCFVRSPAELSATADLLATQLPKQASTWIIHPKQHHKPGFNQNHVRNTALAAGLVDYKVCSVSADWSALKFAHRKTHS